MNSASSAYFKLVVGRPGHAMAHPAVPSLRRLCVLKVVKDIRNFVQKNLPFEDLGQYRFVVGPFEYLCE